MLFNKKTILFYPLLKQFEKQTADPKTADIMPRAKNAETADRQSLINLDAVQNYDEKKASPILIKALPIPLPSVAGGQSC